MTARLGLVALALALSQAPLVMLLAQEPTPAPAPSIPADLPRADSGTFLGTMIDIPWKTHSELIPEHAAWSAFLSHLVHLRAQNAREAEYVKSRLRLSAKDEALLAAALKRFADQRDQVNQNLNLRAAMIRAREKQVAGESFADAESFQMILNYRQAVLDVADGLMAKLSPKGQESLDAYRNEYLAGYTLSIAEGAWSTYKLPR